MLWSQAAGSRKGQGPQPQENIVSCQLGCSLLPQDSGTRFADLWCLFLGASSVCVLGGHGRGLVWPPAEAFSLGSAFLGRIQGEAEGISEMDPDCTAATRKWVGLRNTGPSGSRCPLSHIPHPHFLPRLLTNLFSLFSFPQLPPSRKNVTEGSISNLTDKVRVEGHTRKAK